MKVGCPKCNHDRTAYVTEDIEPGANGTIHVSWFYYCEKCKMEFIVTGVMVDVEVNMVGVSDGDDDCDSCDCDSGGLC